VSRILVVATSGAGGDLQPLVAAALALRGRGHETPFLGDRAVQGSVRDAGLAVDLLPPELDLGPRMAAAVRDAMTTSSGDLVAAGPMVQERMAAWAREAAPPVRQAIHRLRPDAVVTSLFGVEVLQVASPPCPWGVVNSTFYIGPNSPRTLEQDIGPRAIPLVSRYASLLGSADLVLHATDQLFDFSFDGLPPRHHYTGPLGVWEPPGADLPYLREPGDPWVLVSISSQRQDDLPLAQAALAALADRPVRVVLTLGPDHEPSELSERPPNARVEQTVSHAAVLERAVLLISHAGHGSVMKALWHGRPMVLIPWGRDQPGVAARAKALGVAEVVARAEAAGDTLAAAADRVLTNQTMRATAATHSARLRATNAPATAAGLIESIL
jgi:UDP:flavonoid glycosyltransferase YjiC (YdhE family)